MGVRQSLDILERVEQIATLAGFKARLEEDDVRLVLGFDMGDGRHQLVYIRDTSRSADHPVITIFSPCLMVKKGLFRGISKNTAMDLLRTNEAIHFARYGLYETDKYSMIVASIDHLLDKLDPDEFEASVLSVAHAADSYEKKLGKDDF